MHTQLIKHMTMGDSRDTNRVRENIEGRDKVGAEMKHLQGTRV